MERGGGSRRSCARCRKQKKECKPGCPFAPYFPADQDGSFAAVNKVFGADKFIKTIQELPEDRQGDAARTRIDTAISLVQDPVHGCFGEITALQSQLADKTAEVEVLKAEVERLKAEVERLKVLLVADQ